MGVDMGERAPLVFVNNQNIALSGQFVIESEIYFKDTLEWVNYKIFIIMYSKY